MWEITKMNCKVYYDVFKANESIRLRSEEKWILVGVVVTQKVQEHRKIGWEVVYSWCGCNIKVYENDVFSGNESKHEFQSKE